MGLLLHLSSETPVCSQIYGGIDGDGTHKHISLNLEGKKQKSFLG